MTFIFNVSSELIGVLVLGRCKIALRFNMYGAPYLEVVSEARLLSQVDAELLHTEFTLGRTLQPSPLTSLEVASSIYPYSFSSARLQAILKDG